MTNIDVKTAIQNGDAIGAAKALRIPSTSSPKQLFKWHSDTGQGTTALDALIEAGADINFKGMAGQRPLST